ncbi:MULTISPECIES: DNA/RNA helicase domain-containing protein [Acidianus]|uniref:ATP-binding protein n=1 Tax=Candidatus Acidianus copahuensis TaxID=1160895 RepID=A0A031LW81_9CREN|nr:MULTISPECIES: DNA/RNA helicase domain-containing protein [Acidianus]EZQ12035.1 ATP-binding protein [Candidatus Acidianus copahuensis]NON61418.1 DUF2075 domain-containing protein [Acidianus sp. RZ1]
MLPVILKNPIDLRKAVDELSSSYSQFYEQSPRIEQQLAWESSLRNIIKPLDGYPVLAEYPIFTERADFIVVDKTKALVIEAKGWRQIKKAGDFTVKTDDGLHIDPCYQLNNYVGKLNNFHPSNIKFDGIVYAYNLKEAYVTNDCKVIRSSSDLQNEIKQLGTPGDESDINKIAKARVTINKEFLEKVREIKEKVWKRSIMALASEGFGLSTEQALIVSEVLDSLRDNERRAFVIRGESGSGKTLLAFYIFLEALTKKYRTLLAYKNNRLLNTLRYLLRGSKDGAIDSLLMFYSTGRQIGVGESKFQNPYGNDNIDLIIFDEAQRMRRDIIELASTRSTVQVYFYDESQILIGDEEGTEKNFRLILGQEFKQVEDRSLSAPFRVPPAYLESVRKILEGKSTTINGYDFRIFDNIKSLLEDLEKINGKKALVCAFTESPGDYDNPRSDKNRRVGYPLYSGFNLYKNIGVDIYWLMNEKTEYPKYWTGKLNSTEYCASVYGAQGFEADYVGVVWGRDLIWRNNGWEVNPDPITDNVGNRFSLKSIVRRDKEKALQLLKNRYYIMLTRGIKGTFLFFEDDQTGQYMKQNIHI